MRCKSFVTTALALAYASVALADEEVASDVINLTSSTFDAKVNPESLILVEFFAPWCGHCKALAPHYEEAATALKEKDIKVAKVDCVDQAELCQANGVQGYPTLKVFRNGTPSDYTGPRKADGIISYTVKQSLPAVSDVAPADFETFSKADKVVAVLYASSSSAAPAAEFSAAAEQHRDDYLFGLVTDAELAKAQGVTPPAVVVFRAFDEPTTTYPYPIADAKSADFSTWIKDLSVPTIAEVSGDNYAVYASSEKPLAYLFVDPTSEDKEAQIEKVKAVASKYKSKVNFVWIDAVKFGDHAKALNLPEAKWPSFVIQDIQKQLKYPYDQTLEVSTQAVEEYVKSFLDGALKPELKSEPIPETQDESVYTLVGKEFDQVIFDDSKDVFVEFYATWCGHCKRLKPTWDSLGEHFSNVKDRLTIAKMEATQNDIPPSAPFKVSGFPTIKFKPAGSREFIDYNGDRTLENMIAFVQENAKNSLEVVAAPNDSAQAPIAESVAPEASKEEQKEKHDEL